MSSTIQPSIRTAVTSEQVFSLKHGQVVHGSVKKLFPDQRAEVQVGNQKMMAILEVPLKAGDAHYFQVVGDKAALQLKVVTDALNSSKATSSQTKQLMDSLQLPKTTEMQSIVQQMVKEKIPLSKEQLLLAEQWLKEIPPQVKMAEGLLAIQKLSELNLLFTNENFRTLISGQDKNGLHQLLDAFKIALQNDTSIPSSQKGNLDKALAQISQPFSNELGGAILGQVIERLQSQNTSESDKLALLNLLKDVGLVPKQATLANWLSSQVTSIEAPDDGQSLQVGQLLLQLQNPVRAQELLKFLQNMIQQNQLLSVEGKDEIQQLIQKVVQTAPQTREWNTALKSLINEVIKAFAEASQSQPFHTDQKLFTPKDYVLSILTSLNGKELDAKVFEQLTLLSSKSNQLPVQQAFITAEATIQSGINSIAIEQAMKQILGNIGFAYEAKLAKGADLSQLSGSLKPQLLALLQNQEIAATLKETAEMIVSRLNGMQILSGENGPQHQLLMQVPLDFLGKRMDASLQWNGRMKEDGKIDSNYARVMFYLDLASLKETVIDMQIQNRVITINIFNESDALMPYAEQFREALKTGLSSLNYQLSGVFMKSYIKQPEPHPILTEAQVSKWGVDVLI